MRSTLFVCTLLLAAAVTLAAQSPQSDPAKTAQVPASPSQARLPYTAPDESKDGSGHGAEILSDTLGVDFKPYLAKIVPTTRKSWLQLLQKEPVSDATGDIIVFSLMPNGRLEPQSMKLLGRSGNASLDKAAWYSIVNSSYPPLPANFKGPRITIKFIFDYNLQAKPNSPSPAK